MQVVSFLHTYIWSYLHPTPSKRPDAIKLGVLVENAELDPVTSKSFHPKSQLCSTNQGGLPGGYLEQICGITTSITTPTYSVSILTDHLHPTRYQNTDTNPDISTHYQLYIPQKLTQP